ncbi:hypothetical protein GIB67_017937 [Kingdonia uniflora]|uniref:DUF659 domain-containing protein n=1 Tax=Kingdonia uniflora TaxID=39325 RepID=A0A7J7NE49_9MAGN|nr:hypothetical protein GIB67_017937 [Kingdonia uniflora]
MRKDLLEKRSTNLKREVLQLIDYDVPLVRDVRSNSTDESKQGPFVPVQPNCKRKDNVACVTPRENVPKSVLLSNKMGYSPGAAKIEETDEDSSIHAKRGVGSSFMKMVLTLAWCGSAGYDLAQCNELSGWILQEEQKEIDCYVKEVKHSWEITGCSILLDGWINEKGRSLIHFLEDCSRGPIFLRSADISDCIGDVNALVLLIEQVIEEIGAENVVQVVTFYYVGLYGGSAQTIS